MKSNAIISVLMAILLFPAFGVAAEYAQIISETNSVSTTGGIVVSGSGSAAGSSSASVDVRSKVYGERGGSKIEIDIETESDGVIKRESVRKSAASGENIRIEISTTSQGAKKSVKAEVNYSHSTSTRREFSVSDPAQTGTAQSSTRQNLRAFFVRILKRLSILP